LPGPRFSDAQGQLFQSRLGAKTPAPEDDEYVDIVIPPIATELFFQPKGPVFTQPTARVENLASRRRGEFDPLAFRESREENSDYDQQESGHRIRSQL
tara:strand:- start:795 stop:1088 length:294 start_codon:yes stop_codon:yes gene_type:complete